MISAKKLIKLAKKWQKLAALRRKRIALSQMETGSCRASEMADKGHFVVYSADQKRFLLPLNYLNNKIVRELLKLAEEEFGLPTNGPLTLPCDAELIEYVIALIKQGITRDLEKALLVSIAISSCSMLSDLHHQIILTMKLSEKEEFGLSSNGPLTLSCDAELMVYAIALIKQQVSEMFIQVLLNCMDQNPKNTDQLHNFRTTGQRSKEITIPMLHLDELIARHKQTSPPHTQPPTSANHMVLLPIDRERVWFG
ncbi:hypothetical protein D5086_030257 [Populus alba]|uniref:Uncharacterized protein n=1 Tax=Populus alba TaxID=43335 RepID=A0ACC4ANT6_POPAL